MLEWVFNHDSGMSHTNGGPTSGDVAGPVVLELGNNDSDNDHAAEHDDRSDN